MVNGSKRSSAAPPGFLLFFFYISVNNKIVDPIDIIDVITWTIGLGSADGHRVYYIWLRILSYLQNAKTSSPSSSSYGIPIIIYIIPIVETIVIVILLWETWRVLWWAYSFTKRPSTPKRWNCV